MSLALLTLGVSVTQLALRAAGATTGAAELGDALAGVKAVRELLPGQPIPVPPELVALQRAIDAQLQERLLGVTDEFKRQDLEAAADSVRRLFTRLADDDGLIASLATHPEVAYATVLSAGGAELLRTAEAAATPFVEWVLRLASDSFAAAIPRAQRFVGIALPRLLRDTEAIATAQRQQVEMLTEVAANVKALGGGPLPETPDIDSLVKKSLALRATLTLDVLPRVRRDDLVQRSLAAFPSVLLGEGGLGKSVLAGDIVDRESSRRIVLFLPCSVFDSHRRFEDAASFDLAFGEVASGRGLMLSDLLQTIEPRALVVIDTLDLLLTEETADPLRRFLLTIDDVADLVVTSRAREWTELVGMRWDAEAHGQVDQMPRLLPDEVLAWTERFLETSSEPVEVRERFLASVKDAVRAYRGIDVLAVPLRLALACDLYAADGVLPERLTATRLYQTYWSRRIELNRHGRVGVASAAYAALQVAAAIWEESKLRLKEEVAAPESSAALDALISEGALNPTGLRVRFFHQTFAEFAVAKHLAGRAHESDLCRLHDGLAADRPGYWAIASHLLREEVTRARFEELAAAVPLDRSEGARIVLGAAFLLIALGGSEAPDATVLDRLFGPTTLESVPDLLGSAHDQLVEWSFDRVLDALTLSGDNTSRLVQAAATLLLRMNREAGARAYDRALEVLLQRHMTKDPNMTFEVQRLNELVLVGNSADPRFVDVAVQRFSAMPVVARTPVLHAGATTPDIELRDRVLERAFVGRAKVASVDDVVTMAIGVLNDPAARSRFGWSSWRSIAEARHSSPWDHVQVRLICELAADGVVRKEVVEEWLSTNTIFDRTMLANVMKRLAEHQAEGLVATLLEHLDPPTQRVIGAFADACARIAPVSRTDGERLIGRLEGVASTAPRQVWRATVALAAGHSDLLDTVLRDVAHAITQEPTADTAGRIAASALRSLFASTEPERRDGLRTAIDAVAESVPEGGRDAVDVVLVIHDSRYRTRVDETIDSTRFGQLPSALARLVQSRHEWSPEDWQASLPWITRLLRARDDGIVVSVAGALHADCASPTWTKFETDFVVDRFVTALARGDDVQVSRTLLHLIAGLVHDASPESKPTKTQMNSVEIALRNGLKLAMSNGDAHRTAGLYAQYASMLTSVLMPSSALTLRDLALDLLVNVDTGVVSLKAWQALESVLVNTVIVDPSAWASIETRWSEAPERNRWAIAGAVLAGVVPERQVVAGRLARRADCPDDLRRELLRRLDTAEYRVV